MKTRKRRRQQAWRRRPVQPGTAPGTLTVDPEAPRPVLRVMAYGPDGIVERQLEKPEQVRELLGRWPVTWLNVDGLGDVATLQAIAEIFGIHRLALEDVVNVHQRAKVDEYPSHHFIVARSAEWVEDGGLRTEQLAFFLGKDSLVTFQESPGDCFDPIRQRLRTGAGRSRKQGPDYLAYALLDSVVDSYFPLLETYGERLESLEEDILVRTEQASSHAIQEIRRDLLTLRRAVWPLRDTLSSLGREHGALVTPETRIYLRDCTDHAVQIIDLLETYRELSAGLMEVYLTTVSNRMNEIIKLLTIVSTILMSLSFIAGVYGMNFDTERSPLNMPELKWAWGYPFALGLMATVAGVLLLYFRRRGWLGGPRARSAGGASGSDGGRQVPASGRDR